MSKHQMRGAIIGAGYFAGFQAEAWQCIPLDEIVAVVDPLLERAREFAGRYGIPGVYSDAEEILAHKALDFVDIATRPGR
jgi:D-apiose dehydrogenase